MIRIAILLAAFGSTRSLHIIEKSDEYIPRRAQIVPLHAEDVGPAHFEIIESLRILMETVVPRNTHDLIELIAMELRDNTCDEGDFQCEARVLKEALEGRQFLQDIADLGGPLEYFKLSAPPDFDEQSQAAIETTLDVLHQMEGESVSFNDAFSIIEHEMNRLQESEIANDEFKMVGVAGLSVALYSLKQWKEILNRPDNVFFRIPVGLTGRKGRRLQQITDGIIGAVATGDVLGATIGALIEISDIKYGGPARRTARILGGSLRKGVIGSVLSVINEVIKFAAPGACDVTNEPTVSPAPSISMKPSLTPSVSMNPSLKPSAGPATTTRFGIDDDSMAPSAGPAATNRLGIADDSMNLIEICDNLLMLNQTNATEESENGLFNITHISNTPFFVFNTSKTWNECKSHAESNNFELASIRNQFENIDVTNYLNDNGVKWVWLGGYQTTRDDGPRGNWTWTDGTEWTDFSYTNWNPGEPNDVNVEDHLEMSKNGGWNDRNKDAKFACLYRGEMPSAAPSISMKFNQTLFDELCVSMSPSLHLSESPSTHLSFSPSTNTPTLFPSISPSIVSSQSPSISHSPSTSPTSTESQLPSLHSTQALTQANATGNLTKVPQINLANTMKVALTSPQDITKIRRSQDPFEFNPEQDYYE